MKNLTTEHKKLKNKLDKILDPILGKEPKGLPKPDKIHKIDYA